MGRTIGEHDRNLQQVLNGMLDINMTLAIETSANSAKTEITYLGETLTQAGMKPNSNKIKAILECPRPTSKHDLHRLLGMTNVIAKFLPKLSDVAALLRELIKKKNEFDLLNTHEQAFLALEDLIAQSKTLRYYNVTKPVTLQVDVLKNGLGAALIQEHGPVTYASKAINETQCRDAQIEKVLLAVVFACKRFDHYVYGKSITVESDHKPLEAIFQKLSSPAPSRRQRISAGLSSFKEI